MNGIINVALVIDDKRADSHLLVWKIEENVDYFRSELELSKAEEAFYKTIRFDGRRIEYLCARMILCKYQDKKETLLYHKDGRPYLYKSKVQLSISHSKSHLGVLFSTAGAPGLDIELVSGRPSKIYQKFVGEDEMDYVDRSDEKAVTLLWSAKEAIFKMACKQGVNFKTAIQIHPFSVKETGVLSAVFEDSPSVLKLNYKFYDGNAIVWGIDR